MSSTLTINVGQIFLSRPGNTNFTSVYEESVAKGAARIRLFAVIEISEIKARGIPAVRDEYEKLAQAAAGAFKRAILTAPDLDLDDLFEKALAAVNAAVARHAAKGLAFALENLNIAMGAISGHTLCLSTCGNAVVYLLRHNELTALNEGLASEKLKPTKLFANFASGRLSAWDRVLFSNRELLNFLSLDRLRQFFAEETLEDVCKEIIEQIQDIKDTGFAAYVIEAAGSGEKIMSSTSVRPVTSLPVKTKKTAIYNAAKFLLELSWLGLRRLAGFVIHFFRVRPKKYLFGAIALVLIIFAGSLILSSLRNNRQAEAEARNQLIRQIEQKLAEAEGALIYNNNNRALALVPEIERLLDDAPSDETRKDEFRKRLGDLKKKVSKEVHVDNPTVLATFESVPEMLIRSPNGFLAFNQNTGRLAFYDFRSGAVKKILQNQNTGNLGLPLYLGSQTGYVFLDKDGQFQKLYVDNETLTPLPRGDTALVSPADLGHGRAAGILGEEANARLYVLDAKNRQIWRLAVNENAIAAPEAWLKTAGDFTESVAMAIDGAIYVLYPDRLEKFMSGVRQNLAEAALNPAPTALAGIFAHPDAAFLYLLDPENERITVLDKQGRLQKQIISPKFRALTDIYVDEQQGLLYALAGNELLQVGLK